MFQVFVMSVLFAVLWWSVRLARRIGCGLVSNRLTSSAIAFTLTFGPGEDFGQREHFAVLFGMPMLFVAAWRYEGREIPPRHAFVAGLVATLGLGLKPQFLLAPALLMLLMPSGRRSRITPELCGLLLGVLAYAGHVFVVPFSDDFFATVDTVRANYGAYRIPLLEMIGQPWTIRALGYASLLTICMATARRRRRILAVFVLFAWAFVAIAVWQSKGWSYHLVPCFLFAWIGLILALLGARLRFSRELAIVGLLGLAALPLGQRWFQRDADGELAWSDSFTGLPAGFHAVRGLQPGESALVVDTELPTWFAYLRDHDLRSGSRFACLWPLPAADAAGRARLLEQVAADLQRYRPRLVYVRVGRPRYVAGDFELERWLAGAREWGEYAQVSRAPGFTVWRRRE